MTRPSRNLDQDLTRAGLKLAAKHGIAGLKVREVARLAGVNPGMFHYYFKSKNEFARRVLQQMYEDFFSRLQLASETAGSPLERLRRTLLALALHVRDHRPFLYTMLRDTVQGHKHAVKLVRDNFHRHLAIIAGLIAECQRDGSLKALPVPVVFSILMSSIAAPNLIVELMERNGARRPFGMEFDKVKELMVSDAAVETRLNIALKGLSPDKASR